MNLMNEKGFEEIYTLFRKPVGLWVGRIVKNGEQIEDVTQEVFLKLLSHYDRYDPTRPLAAWLSTFTKNAAIDWMRKQKLTTMISCEVSFFEEIISTEPNPEMKLSQIENRRLIYDAFRALTKLQRRVVWLRFIRSLSYEEIAESLGVSLSSVKCALGRARQSFCANPLIEGMVDTSSAL